MVSALLWRHCSLQATTKAAQVHPRRKKRACAALPMHSAQQGAAGGQHVGLPLQGTQRAAANDACKRPQAASRTGLSQPAARPRLQQYTTTTIHDYNNTRLQQQYTTTTTHDIAGYSTQKHGATRARMYTSVATGGATRHGIWSKTCVQLKRRLQGTERAAAGQNALTKVSCAHGARSHTQASMSWSMLRRSMQADKRLYRH